MCRTAKHAYVTKPTLRLPSPAQQVGALITVPFSLRPLIYLVQNTFTSFTTYEVPFPLRHLSRPPNQGLRFGQQSLPPPPDTSSPNTPSLETHASSIFSPPFLRQKRKFALRSIASSRILHNGVVGQHPKCISQGSS